MISTIPSTITTDSKWYCHCCRYKNNAEAEKCKVCGRDPSYAQQGYSLPLHGAGSKLYRPNQLSTIVTEEGLFERDSVQWTALHSAAVNGNYPVAEELIRRGCLIDAVSDHGQTPLHLAVYSGSLDTARILVENNSNVNAATFFEKMTPLHIACQRDWKQIAKFLIDHGADVNAGNVIDRAPLHFVAQSGRTDLGVMLLKAGADPNKMDSQGWTPRQVAEFHERREMQELLVQVNMTDKQVVIKKLPPAPWHSELWDSTIRINKEIRQRAVNDMEVTEKLLAQAEAWWQSLTHKPERESRIELFDQIGSATPQRPSLTSQQLPASLQPQQSKSKPLAIVIDRNPSTRSNSVTTTTTTATRGATDIVPFSRTPSIGTDISSLTGSHVRSQLQQQQRVGVSNKTKMLTAAATRVLVSK